MTDPDTDAAPEALPPFQGRIFIDADGQVVFDNLDPGLAEVAHELDPEGAIACEVPAIHDADNAGA